MQINRYYLTVTAENVAFRVALNDAAVAVESSGIGFNADTPVNAWLHPKENTMRIDIQWPEEIPYAAGIASLSAQLYLHDNESESPKPARVLASFTWPVPLVPEVYPFMVELPVVGEYILPTRLWSEAEKLAQLTSDDESAILNLLNDYRTALLGRDASGVYRFLRYKSEDLARADYHEDLAEIEEIDLEQINWMLGLQPEAEVPALPLRERMEFDLVGHNQVVHVYRRGGGPALALTGKRADFGFDIFVARIEGEWKVVR